MDHLISGYVSPPSDTQSYACPSNSSFSTLPSCLKSPAVCVSGPPFGAPFPPPLLSLLPLPPRQRREARRRPSCIWSSDIQSALPLSLSAYLPIYTLAASPQSGTKGRDGDWLSKRKPSRDNRLLGLISPADIRHAGLWDASLQWTCWSEPSVGVRVTVASGKSTRGGGESWTNLQGIFLHVLRTLYC